MLFDKILNRQRRKRKRSKDIRHKMTTVILIVLIFTYAMSEITRIIFLHLKTPFNILVAGIIFISYAYFISDFTANLISYKFVSQVNKMTDIAKAISNSKDLKKRVDVSDHPDELSSLEEALNGMLDKLENAFEKQKQFVSDASHELRTPLSIIKGYLDILDEWGKKDDILLDESIQSMKEETYHMKKLLENLLFLARTDQGQLVVSYEYTKLDNIIEKLICDTKMIAGERTIKCNISETVTINGDKELILQMLRALVENCIKYTEENGEITINLYKQENYALIEVIDNGIGISEKDIQKIFDRFYRVKEVRTKDSGGNGLGLSLVKKIVDIHNGKINVTSELGKGTKMSVYIPLKVSAD